MSRTQEGRNAARYPDLAMCDMQEGLQEQERAQDSPRTGCARPHAFPRHSCHPSIRICQRSNRRGWYFCQSRTGRVSQRIELTCDSIADCNSCPTGNDVMAEVSEEKPALVNDVWWNDQNLMWNGI